MERDPGPSQAVEGRALLRFNGRVKMVVRLGHSLKYRGEESDELWHHRGAFSFHHWRGPFFFLMVLLLCVQSFVQLKFWCLCLGFYIKRWGGVLLVSTIRERIFQPNFFFSFWENKRGWKLCRKKYDSFSHIGYLIKILHLRMYFFSLCLEGMELTHTTFVI